MFRIQKKVPGQKRWEEVTERDTIDEAIVAAVAEEKQRAVEAGTPARVRIVFKGEVVWS